ncbi:hypothetical protein GCM10010104_29860 [Streptomyces indiaensis]|uniref:Uncharacterized protein n=1 Tax=Streptomyces indiaensis TaxID=284033 RepID=A0ABN3DJH1_9ACTN
MARHVLVRSGFVYLRHKVRLGGCGVEDKVRLWDETPSAEERAYPLKERRRAHGT